VLDETTAPDTEIAYVDISSVDGVNGINAKEAMLFSAAPSRARRRVKHGDVLVSTVRTYLRAIARIREPEDNLVVSTGFAVVRPREALVPDFLGNALSASYFIEQVIARSTGVSYPAINASELVAIPVTVPPKDEQTAIAEFLDRETGKIDALVAEQRRLMELLKEKRQAVISHAVTRGQNPTAPLKPSGIEWLGDVPEHWEVLPAKRISTVFVPQRNKPELNSDGEGVCWMTMEQMRNEEVTTTDLWVSEAAARDAGTRILKPGAVIASCVGTFGLAVINNAEVIINQQLQAFIPNRRIHAKFLRHCVVNAASYFEQIGTAATITYVNQFGFENMPLVLPPLDEQSEIVAFLATEAAKFDTLTTEAKRAIDLLQERRTALISAAITGQIDVRAAVLPP
jgi:type I restriction enzyme S subunit